MESTKTENLNEIMDELASRLNISNTMEDKAVRAYTTIGEWLEGNAEGEDVVVYPQGSFGLGTVVRPLSGADDDYDIDLVCNLPEMYGVSARDIKMLPGKRLKENALYASKMEPEGKRCWTLDYEQFHVDILPCTNESPMSDERIRLTNKDPNTGIYSDKFSNPKGYKHWFEDRMSAQLNEAKSRYAGLCHCSIESVETFRVKTTLQKAVQILKHHRNMMFDGKENKPVSIILTTLSAMAYNGEIGVYDALMSILMNMDSFIEGVPGQYRITNPANTKENFADRWNEKPEKAKAFFVWLSRAKRDFASLQTTEGLDEIGRALEKSVGENMSNRAIKAYSQSIREKRESGGLYATSAGLTTSASLATKVVPNHTFYGA